MSRAAKVIKLRHNADHIASLIVFQDEARLAVGDKSGVFVTEGGTTIAGGLPSKVAVQAAAISYGGLAQTTPFPFTLMSSMYSPPQQLPNIPFALTKDLIKMVSVASALLL